MRRRRGGSSYDAAAIHSNRAGELSRVPEKKILSGTDFILIEDSAAGGSKKCVQITNLLLGGGKIPTMPPAGAFHITNLYVDSATGTLQVEYEDTQGAQPSIVTLPPEGDFPVTNLYVENGKLQVEYEV